MRFPLSTGFGEVVYLPVSGAPTIVNSRCEVGGAGLGDFFDKGCTLHALHDGDRVFFY